MVCNPQIARSGYKLYILCSQISLLRKPESLHPACSSAEYIAEILIVNICYAQLALLKKKSLTPLVIVKILVLIGPDMIPSEIRKYSNLKRNAGCTVKHQSLRRNFHYNTVAPRFHHLCKILLDRIRLGRCIRRRYLLIADNCLDRAYKPYFITHAVKNGFNHIGCSSLAFRSRYADNFHLFRRVSEIGGRHKRQSISRILYADHRHIFIHLYFAFYNHSRRSL